MKSMNNYIKTSVLVGGTVLASCLASQAGVTVELTGLGDSESGFTIGSLVDSSAYIGIYQFSLVDPNNNDQPYYNFMSVCLSPVGQLGYGAFNYNVLTFAQANPGQYPSAWAWNGNNANPQYWGINNAYAVFASNLANVTDDTSGAALNLAIWTALYDSTGYGNSLNQGAGSFYSQILAGSLNGGSILTGQLATDYWADLAALNGVSGPVANGDILQGTPTVDGITAPIDPDQQELLLPVPEPSTIFAGALLLLPLGASAMRIVRRNRGE